MKLKKSKKISRNFIENVLQFCCKIKQKVINYFKLYIKFYLFILYYVISK